MDRRSIRSTITKEQYYPKANVFELELLLMRCRRGDSKARDVLILSFIGLASAIACRLAAHYPNRDEDILGEALRCMIECIDNVIKGNQHDHKTLAKYIHKTVFWNCQEYVKVDFTVRPPLNSDWMKQRVIEYGSYHDALEMLRCVPYEVEQSEGSFMSDYINKETVNKDLPEQNPYAVFVENELEQSDFFTPREKKIIQARLEGYDDDEIGQMLGLTKARVGQIRKGLHKKVITILGVIK